MINAQQILKEVLSEYNRQREDTLQQPVRELSRQVVILTDELVDAVNEELNALEILYRNGRRD